MSLRSERSYNGNRDRKIMKRVKVKIKCFQIKKIIPNYQNNLKYSVFYPEANF